MYPVSNLCMVCGRVRHCLLSHDKTRIVYFFSIQNYIFKFVCSAEKMLIGQGGKNLQIRNIYEYQ